jgi:hypothetical protein
VHEAVAKGHGMAMVPLLCTDGGLDINCEKKNGLRPIEVAEKMSDHRLKRLMIELGASGPSSGASRPSSGSGAAGAAGDEGGSECVICLDKPTEGAFVPCGEIRVEFSCW